jgi:tetratricopeptide (TPR) repeat protein
VIEILLQAERALTVGLLDQAERLYRQAVDSDPRNSIAVVGLARVALERGDETEALSRARAALEIDPDNVAAKRLADRLVEISSGQVGTSEPPAEAAEPATAAAEPSSDQAEVAEPPDEPAPTGRRRAGLFRRLLGRG